MIEKDCRQDNHREMGSMSVSLALMSKGGDI